MKSVALHNLGCKVNGYEMDVMQQELSEHGYRIVPFDTIADIYIINTCTVTNIADRKSRQMLHRAKKENPQAVVVAVGCYVETDQEGVQKDTCIDIAIGNNRKSKIVEILDDYFAECEQGTVLDKTMCDETMDDIAHTSEYEQMQLEHQPGHTRAYIKIQDGCNQFCSYCIIPYARGRLRSRSLTSIKKEIENLVASGYKEVVLLGIHLGAYGKDFSEKISLVNAVKTALAVPGLERLRLGSLECIEIEDEMLELLATESRLAKHLHLPLQSGSDSILRKMNRPYTVDEYRILIEKIRKKVPEIAIKTDVIVGFPGETENLFQETYKFMEELQFSKTHIFPFSRRKNTPAEKYPQQVLKEIKQQRVKQLTFLDQKSHESFLNMNKNIEEIVLFEQQKYGYFTGYTSNYIRVYVNSDSVNLENKLYSVITQDVFKDGLMAVLK